jgi:uncharacterized membrane protein YjjP (DUF1212 family)
MEPGGNQERNRKVLELTTRIGEVLLKNGGEIFRVQETMQRIAKAYGVKQFHVYVLANGIFTSIEEDGQKMCRQLAQEEPRQGPDDACQVRYVPLSSVHLGRVAAVNNLSREIVENRCTMEQAWRRIEEIDQIPFTSQLFQVLASGVGSAAFCYLLGGSVLDSLASFLSGMLVWCFVLFLSAHKANKIMLNILSSALVTLTGVLFFHFVFGENMDKIIIGSIIPLLPGVPLTNSIRDFLNGDYLSGTIRMIDAVLVACCIALGVGIVLSLFTLMTGMTV